MKGLADASYLELKKKRFEVLDDNTSVLFLDHDFNLVKTFRLKDVSNKIFGYEFYPASIFEIDATHNQLTQNNAYSCQFKTGDFQFSVQFEGHKEVIYRNGKEYQSTELCLKMANCDLISFPCFYIYITNNIAEFYHSKLYLFSDRESVRIIIPGDTEKGRRLMPIDRASINTICRNFFNNYRPHFFKDVKNELTIKAKMRHLSESFNFVKSEYRYWSFRLYLL